jgi:hypothetical protein
MNEELFLSRGNSVYALEFFLTTIFEVILGKESSLCGIALVRVRVGVEHTGHVGKFRRSLESE